MVRTTAPFFIGDGGRNFVCRLLQLNTKRRGRGHSPFFTAGSRKNSGAGDHHAVTDQLLACNDWLLSICPEIDPSVVLSFSIPLTVLI